MQTTTIQAGQTLTARSIGDYDCVYSLEIISRKGAWAVIKQEGKDARRVKVRTWDGVEFVQPERYSFAPQFRATTASKPDVSERQMPPARPAMGNVIHVEFSAAA